FTMSALGTVNSGNARAQSVPSISSIAPGQGPVGTSVTINGQNFGASQVSGSTVTFNGVAAGPATTWTNTQIVVPVPSGASTGQIYVTTTAGTSNGAYFRVGTFSEITSGSPGQRPAGTAVTMTDEKFCG